MKVPFSPRNPKIACVLIPLGLILIVNLIGCPAFRPPGEVDARAGLDRQPLTAPDLPKKLRKVLDRPQWRDMADSEGFIYGVSNLLPPARWATSTLAQDMNRAIGLAQQGSLPFALKHLERHHSAYPAKVTGTNGALADEMPERREALVGYGLVRYNRAVVLMGMAELLDPRDLKRGQLLQRACYDLRRAVGAFERLGKLDRYGGEPYWGRDVMAWDGFALEDVDSGLAIHQVYANLAMAYLRLGNQEGYPGIERNYMAREARKYTTGQTKLSGAVSLLIQSCLDDEALSLRKYRLTMALQNLEAASRGMANAGEVRYNYAIGLVLAQLYRLDEGVVPEQAVGFLELAARSGNSGRGDGVAMAASRELALIYLELKRDGRFLTVLEDLTPAGLRGNQSQTLSVKKLHFADVAIYGLLRRGEWQVARNHIAFREEELAGQLANDEVLNQHREMVIAVCEASMDGLRRHLRATWNAGDGDRMTGYLLGLRGHDALHDGGPLAKAYRNQVWLPLSLFPGTQTSLYLAHRPALRVAFKALPWLLIMGLGTYVCWLWNSHRKVAAHRLQSGYAEDIHAG